MIKCLYLKIVFNLFEKNNLIYFKISWAWWWLEKELEVFNISMCMPTWFNESLYLLKVISKTKETGKYLFQKKRNSMKLILRITSHNVEQYKKRVCNEKYLKFKLYSSSEKYRTLWV